MRKLLPPFHTSSGFLLLRRLARILYISLTSNATKKSRQVQLFNDGQTTRLFVLYLVLPEYCFNRSTCPLSTQVALHNFARNIEARKSSSLRDVTAARGH